MRVSTKNLLVAAVVAGIGCSGDTQRAPGGRTRTGDSSIATGAAPASPIARQGLYVGNRYETLPRGVTLVSGAVIPAARGAGEFEMARVRTARGDMIWFDSLSHTARATPTRIVRAELRVPPLGRDEQLLMGSCDVSGVLDARVVAIVVREPNVTKFTQVRQAWRANGARGQFEMIPVGGITCEEPGG